MPPHSVETPTKRTFSNLFKRFQAIEMSDYTAEQEKLVLRILSHRPHQYYQILNVSKTSTEGDIKKSYRKIAVKLHPDKNSHPRAAEAFKILNKAWEVLSDPQKKSIFDQTGSDPTSRFLGHQGQQGANATGFNGAFRNTAGFQQRGGFDDDIFNMFFGGQHPGATTFTFGGNGFTFQGGDPFAQFRQQAQNSQRKRQSQQQQQQQEASTIDVIKQLMPLLLFLLVALFGSLFSGNDEVYSMQATSKFSVKRETPQYHIPFFVQEDFAADKSELKLRRFDRKVENEYIQDKKTMCSRENTRRTQLMEEAQGWFSVDEVMMAHAKAMPMPNCEELHNYGII